VKKVFRFWFSCFFVGDVTSGIGLGLFWLRLLGPELQPLDGSILLKYLLETRLKSESFEPLIGFLAFLVQKLWSKNHVISNFIKIGNFTLTFESETSESQ